MRSTHKQYQTLNTTTIYEQSSNGGNLFNDSYTQHVNDSQFRVGQDQGYAALASDHMAKPGFNSTQPRFNYVKEQVKRSEVPGPGSYNNRLNTDAMI